MIRQILRLTKVQSCNLFRLNEIRFTKDTKMKNRQTGMLLVYVMLAGILVFYVTALSMGLATVNLTGIIPMYLFMITGVVILFFSIFKAGSIIFQTKSFEVLSSLPLSQTAIVVSRFLYMYVSDLIIAFLVMLPGMIVYAVNLKPSVEFYLYGIIGILVLPLLPITVATAIGALVTAVSSRMKHKSIAYALLTLLSVAGIIFLEYSIAGQAESMSKEVLENLGATIGEKIGMLYPPALWFNNATVNHSILQLLLLLAVSVGIFLAVIVLLQWRFESICSALNATAAKNNYKMQELAASSQLKSLWKREVKRYFASGIYVSNTSIGYIMMAVASIALLIVGTDKLDTLLGLPGIVESLFPLALAMMATLMPTTACSISMEGKEWWIMKTLPVRSRDILTGKLLLNLTIAAPFYIIAVVFGLIALRPDFITGLLLVLIPAAYILFSSLAGLYINLKIPVFNWENEVSVVKQSASAFLSMLVDVISVILPIVAVLMVKDETKPLVMAVLLVVLLTVSFGLYAGLGKKDLMKIG